MFIKKFLDRFKWFILKQPKQPLNSIHSAEAFRLILERERARTERTGHGFSLVVFNMGNIENSTACTEHLTKMLRQRVRLSDEVGWFEERNIGVVLPSTSAEGAWKIADDICQRVTATVNHIDCRIYTYPHNWLPEENEYFRQIPLPGIFHEHDKVMFQGLPIYKDVAINGYTPSIVLEPVTKLQASSRRVEGLESLFVLRLSVWKRCLDIIGAGIGLIVFSPVMLAVTVAIKLTSPGPILYKQKRIGLLGNKFTFLKFRSMYSGCEENKHKEYIKYLIKNSNKNNNQTPKDNKFYKMEDDHRITPLGRILRKSSLDELPQLFNVLIGDMSLVGPRPHPLYEVAEYSLWFKRRLEMKPGITGLWQVSGRSILAYSEMIRLDLGYIRNFSLLNDLKILLKTVVAVVSTKGAY